MNVDEVLEAVEQVLLSKQLSPIERFVLRQSWLGYGYSKMAQDCAYGIPHLKEVGSQLWHDLSEALGEKVTKKNLHLVVNQYQQSRAGEQQSRVQQEVQTNTEIKHHVASPITQTQIEFPSGPVPLDSPLYINRPPVEELVYSEITHPGCLSRIKAPRLMGKSSLLARILARAKAIGYKSVYLDFQEADSAIFVSLDKFLRWFCANVGRQLNLNSMLDEYWDEDMGSKVSCKIYFEGYLLKQIDSPVVLALNEVNRVFEHPRIAQDFLPMLRSWHEQAQSVKIWQKLRVVVVHSTEVYVPLKINQSPFNVGLSVGLPPFNSEQVQDLAQRHGLDWIDGSETQQLMAMVGGHPYLVSVALYYLHREKIALKELLQGAPTPTGIYSHHLRGYLAMLKDQPQLASALQQVVMADESVRLEAIAAYKLESMGLVQLDGNHARPSCQLYRLYFREQLKVDEGIDSHPEQLQKEQPDAQNSLNIDQLTKLVNRGYFNQYLEAQWQQRMRELSQVSLLMCDIDYFQLYNKTHGYLAGDACLQKIASAIQDCVSHLDAVVARYGGKEFAVLLPQTDAQAAVAIAQNIRESVKALEIAHEQSQFDGFPAPVLTVSLGVANMTPSPRTSPAMLINAAENALSVSQRQGRDRVTLYQAKVNH
ncbi:MAG TPA: hypothetical protein DCP31_20845 [Cyanobacteria bacterium UBA8543]|nr:hypothetical protein [Cyanobacteria bacterium UBA8543]